VAAEGKIRVGIYGHDAGFGKSMDSAWRKADTFTKKMALLSAGLVSTGKAMTMFVTVPIVAGMAAATKMAIDEQKEMALLAKALRTNAQASDANVAAAERWITKMQMATGIADGELRPALAQLVAVTKDVGKAEQLMAMAMDVSAAKGLPLATVTKALGRAYLGNVGALGRLGIATKDYTVDSVKLQAAKAALLTAEENYTKVLKDGNATAAERATAAARLATAHKNLEKVMAGTTGTVMTFEQVMKNLSNTFGGSAATAADTAAGRMLILKQKIIELAESLGTALIPFVEKAVKALTKLADWAANNQGIVKWGLGIAAVAGPLMFLTGKAIAFGIAVGKLGTILAGARVALAGVGAAGSAAGGFAGLAAAVGPGGWLIAGLIAAAAAGYLVYRKVKDLDTAVVAFNANGDRIRSGGASYGMKQLERDTTGAGAAINALNVRMRSLQERFAERLKMGRLENGDLINAITLTQNRINLLKDGLKRPMAVGHLQNQPWNTSIGASQSKFEYFKSLLKNSMAVGHLNTSGWTGALGAAISQANYFRSLVQSPMWVGHITNNNPTRLASGGIVTRPTLALIGESGPEAVIPLSGRSGVATQVINDYSRLVINLPPGLSAATAKSIARSEIQAFEARKASAGSAARRGSVRG
jgi:hypothetical protein